MSEIVTRIGEYGFRSKISMRMIESTIGSANGTLSKAVGTDKDVQTKWISRFVHKFPEVNPAWLVTGKGEMLKANMPYASDLVEEPQDEASTKYSVREKQEVVDALKKLVASMESQLKDKERLIEMKDQLIRELTDKSLK